jgi:hypothetical protein
MGNTSSVRPRFRDITASQTPIDYTTGKTYPQCILHFKYKPWMNREVKINLLSGPGCCNTKQYIPILSSEYEQIKQTNQNWFVPPDEFWYLMCTTFNEGGATYACNASKIINALRVAGYKHAVIFKDSNQLYILQDKDYEDMCAWFKMAQCPTIDIPIYSPFATPYISRMQSYLSTLTQLPKQHAEAVTINAIAQSTNLGEFATKMAAVANAFNPQKEKLYPEVKQWKEIIKTQPIQLLTPPEVVAPLEAKRLAVDALNEPTPICENCQENIEPEDVIRTKYVDEAAPINKVNINEAVFCGPECYADFEASRAYNITDKTKKIPFNAIQNTVNAWRMNKLKSLDQIPLRAGKNDILTTDLKLIQTQEKAKIDALNKRYFTELTRLDEQSKDDRRNLLKRPNNLRAIQGLEETDKILHLEKQNIDKIIYEKEDQLREIENHKDGLQIVREKLHKERQANYAKVADIDRRLRRTNPNDFVRIERDNTELQLLRRNIYDADNKEKDVDRTIRMLEETRNAVDSEKERLRKAKSKINDILLKNGDIFPRSEDNTIKEFLSILRRDKSPAGIRTIDELSKFLEARGIRSFDELQKVLAKDPHTRDIKTLDDIRKIVEYQSPAKSNELLGVIKNALFRDSRRYPGMVHNEYPYPVIPANVQTIYNPDGTIAVVPNYYPYAPPTPVQPLQPRTTAQQPTRIRETQTQTQYLPRGTQTQTQTRSRDVQPQMQYQQPRQRQVQFQPREIQPTQTQIQYQPEPLSPIQQIQYQQPQPPEQIQIQQPRPLSPIQPLPSRQTQPEQIQIQQTRPSQPTLLQRSTINADTQTDAEPTIITPTPPSATQRFLSSLSSAAKSIGKKVIPQPSLFTPAPSAAPVQVTEGVQTEEEVKQPEEEVPQEIAAEPIPQVVEQLITPQPEEEIEHPEERISEPIPQVVEQLITPGGDNLPEAEITPAGGYYESSQSLIRSTPTPAAPQAATPAEKSAAKRNIENIIRQQEERLQELQTPQRTVQFTPPTSSPPRGQTPISRAPPSYFSRSAAPGSRPLSQITSKTGDSTTRKSLISQFEQQSVSKHPTRESMSSMVFPTTPESSVTSVFDVSQHDVLTPATSFVKEDEFDFDNEFDTIKFQYEALKNSYDENNIDNAVIQKYSLFLKGIHEFITNMSRAYRSLENPSNNATLKFERYINGAIDILDDILIKRFANYKDKRSLIYLDLMKEVREVLIQANLIQLKKK